jgi:hypothetical protein
VDVAGPETPEPSLQELPSPAAIASALRAVDPTTKARTVQRLQHERGNAFVQRMVGHGRSDSDGADDLADRIAGAAGGGRDLDPRAQVQLEEAMDADLSAVRIHDDAEADSLARGVDAVAFTTGRDIFFRSGAYRPRSPRGMRLLAHEAAHVVQQAAHPVGGRLMAKGLFVSDPSDAYERAADAHADRVASWLARGARGPPFARAPHATVGSAPLAGNGAAGKVVQRCGGNEACGCSDSLEATFLQRCGGNQNCACSTEASAAREHASELTIQRAVVCDEETGECWDDAEGSQFATSPASAGVQEYGSSGVDAGASDYGSGFVSVGPESDGAQEDLEAPDATAGILVDPQPGEGVGACFQRGFASQGIASAVLLVLGGVCAAACAATGATGCAICVAIALGLSIALVAQVLLDCLGFNEHPTRHKPGPTSTPMEFVEADLPPGPGGAGGCRLECNQGPIPHPTIREKSKGAPVGELQEKLNEAFESSPTPLIPPLEIDCDFGPKTRDAVLRFQSENALDADGIVGPRTWAAVDLAAPRLGCPVPPSGASGTPPVVPATGGF